MSHQILQFGRTTMKSERLVEEMPDRSDNDIPLQLRYILSLTDVVIGWTAWQQLHHNESRTYFYEGLFDYWWDDDHTEPGWEQLFREDPESGELRGFPARDRFCYQQGAILGYRLRCEFKDDS
jgi:hypothetical protein